MEYILFILYLCIPYFINFKELFVLKVGFEPTRYYYFTPAPKAGEATVTPLELETKIHLGRWATPGEPW